LSAELHNVDPMLGHFSRTEKNDRNIIVVTRAQFGIFVDINFREARIE
jgi:hypothetical protein